MGLIYATLGEHEAAVSIPIFATQFLTTAFLLHSIIAHTCVNTYSNTDTGHPG